MTGITVVQADLKATGAREIIVAETTVPSVLILGIAAAGTTGETNSSTIEGISTATEGSAAGIEDLNANAPRAGKSNVASRHLATRTPKVAPQVRTTTALRD